MEIRIYFEGNKGLRSGFLSFFAELTTAPWNAGSRLEVIAAKDGPSMYRKAERTHPQAWNILLQDSEGPVPAQHAKDIFWMVQLMESWFLAHPKMLSDYYGVGFLVNSIGERADIEQVPKAEVLNLLKRATKHTNKGEYHKVKHAPFLLEKLDSGRVRARSEHCRRLFDSVLAKLAG